MRSIARNAVMGLCVLAASGAFSAALALRGMMRGGPDAEMPRLERLADRLDLAEKQIDQIKELREERLSERIELRKEMLRIQNELRGELLEDNPDADRVKKLAIKKGEIRTQMEIARLEHRLAMREILTPEQRDKLFMLRGPGMRGKLHREGRGFGHGRMGRTQGRRGAPGPGLGLGPRLRCCQ